MKTQGLQKYTHLPYRRPFMVTIFEVQKFFFAWLIFFALINHFLCVRQNFSIFFKTGQASMHVEKEDIL